MELVRHLAVGLAELLGELHFAGPKEAAAVAVVAAVAVAAGQLVAAAVVVAESAVAVVGQWVEQRLVAGQRQQVELVLGKMDWQRQ
jgi:hypothetical protein